jgi:hypothetical protein
VGGLDRALEVELVGLTLVDEPAGWMREDREVGAFPRRRESNCEPLSPLAVGAESGRRAVSVLVRIRYPREHPMQGTRRLWMILGTA